MKSHYTWSTSLIPTLWKNRHSLKSNLWLFFLNHSLTGTEPIKTGPEAGMLTDNLQWIIKSVCNLKMHQDYNGSLKNKICGTDKFTIKMLSNPFYTPQQFSQLSFPGLPNGHWTFARHDFQIWYLLFSHDTYFELFTVYATKLPRQMKQNTSRLLNDNKSQQKIASRWTYTNFQNILTLIKKIHDFIFNNKPYRFYSRFLSKIKKVWNSSCIKKM